MNHGPIAYYSDNGSPCPRCESTIKRYFVYSNGDLTVYCYGCRQYDCTFNVGQAPTTARECSALERAK